MILQYMKWGGYRMYTWPVQSPVFKLCGIDYSTTALTLLLLFFLSRICILLSWSTVVWKTKLLVPLYHHAVFQLIIPITSFLQLCKTQNHKLNFHITRILTYWVNNLLQTQVYLFCWCTLDYIFLPHLWSSEHHRSNKSPNRDIFKFL